MNRWDKIKNGILSSFKGGIHPAEHKHATCNYPSIEIKLPKKLVLPLKQHSGSAAEVLVKEGQHVKAGEPLTAPHSSSQVPIHAPASGIIEKLTLAPVPHPSGLSEPCLILTTDSEDKQEVFENKSYPNFEKEDPDTLLELIRDMGIAGLGGAGFPTEKKLRSSMDAGNCELLIINGAECEPYITCDDRLMQERPNDILDGIRIMQHILKPKYTVIAIEDNKPNAIKAIEEALKAKRLPDTRVTVIPVKYPSGAARILIKIITGIEIPYGARSTAYGVVVHNVSTAYSVGEAVIKGQPLTRRLVTIAGDSLEKQGNAWTYIGTSILELLNECGYKKQEKPRVIIGGPMMGFTIPNADVPVIKTVNCVIAPSDAEICRTKPQVDCIRCGRCAHACPSRLLPYELYDLCVNGEYSELNKHNARNCIECGCCAFVCPSAIRIVAAIRIARAELKKEKLKADKMKTARIRFEEKQKRIQEEERIRAEKKAAALARIKAQKEAQAKKASEEAPVAKVAEAPKANLAAEEKIHAAKEKMAALKAAKENASQVASKEQTQESTAPKVASTAEDRIRAAKEKMAAIKAAKENASQSAPIEQAKESPATKVAPTAEDRIRAAKEKMAAIKAAKEKAQTSSNNNNTSKED